MLAKTLKVLQSGRQLKTEHNQNKQFQFNSSIISRNPAGMIFSTTQAEQWGKVQRLNFQLGNVYVKVVKDFNVLKY